MVTDQALAFSAEDAGRLEAVAALLEKCAPQEILKWAFNQFAGSVAVATGFGAEGVAMIDMAVKINPRPDIFFIDTGFLFPETLRLRERLAERYRDLSFEPRSPSLTPEAQELSYGPELWARDPDTCCTIRKVEPMREALDDVDVWVTGLMRSQAPSRSGLRVVEWDWRYQLLKVNPLAGWDRARVWEYVRQHEVPYNELHDRGYPTLGCTHCTLPVAGNSTGEYTREGRWQGRKTECGLHQIVGRQRTA